MNTDNATGTTASYELRVALIDKISNWMRDYAERNPDFRPEGMANLTRADSTETPCPEITQGSLAWAPQNEPNPHAIRQKPRRFARFHLGAEALDGQTFNIRISAFLAPPVDIEILAAQLGDPAQWARVTVDLEATIDAYFGR